MQAHNRTKTIDAKRVEEKETMNKSCYQESKKDPGTKYCSEDGQPIFLGQGSFSVVHLNIYRGINVAVKLKPKKLMFVMKQWFLHAHVIPIYHTYSLYAQKVHPNKLLCNSMELVCKQ